MDGLSVTAEMHMSGVWKMMIIMNEPDAMQGLTSMENYWIHVI
jgi:hypothetical protein